MLRLGAELQVESRSIWSDRCGMNDPRLQKLAEVLVEFSTSLKSGERVLIDAFDVPEAMVIALIRATRERKAYPYVQLHRARVTRELLVGAEDVQYQTAADVA